MRKFIAAIFALALLTLAAPSYAILGTGPAMARGVATSVRCASFTPASITNIRAWWRADLGVTTVSGLVSAWADQSGAGDANRNATQGTAGNRPTLNASDAAFNNQASIGTFTTATNIRLVTGTWSSNFAPPYTVVVIGNVLDQTGNRYIFTQSSGFTIISLLNNSTNMGSATLGAGGAITSTVASNRSINSPAFLGMEVFSSPANAANVYVNSLWDHSYDSGSVSASGTLQNVGAAAVTLGSFSSGTANTSGGKMAESWVASGVVNTAQKSCEQYYVNTRYALKATP